MQRMSSEKPMTARASGGREIDRSEFAEAVTANSMRYIENAALYRKRQEINEHIFAPSSGSGATTTPTSMDWKKLEVNTL